MAKVAPISVSFLQFQQSNDQQESSSFQRAVAAGNDLSHMTKNSGVGNKKLLGTEPHFRADGPPASALQYLDLFAGESSSLRLGFHVQCTCSWLLTLDLYQCFLQGIQSSACGLCGCQCEAPSALDAEITQSRPIERPAGL